MRKQSESFFFNFLKICFIDLQSVSFCCTAKCLRYTYVYFIFQTLFHYVFSQDIEYSSLCSTGTLLFIHSLHNSLHLLTPNSQSIPPPSFSPLATTRLFPLSVNLFVFHRCVHLCHFLDSKYIISSGICFSLPRGSGSLDNLPRGPRVSQRASSNLGLFDLKILLILIFWFLSL